MSPAPEPVATQAVLVGSTVSSVDEFGASSTLIHANADPDAAVSQASAFEADALTCSWPSPVKFLSSSTSNTTSTVLNGPIRDRWADAFLMDRPASGELIETAVSSMSIGPPL